MKKAILYVLDWLYFIFFCTPLALFVYITVCVFFWLASLVNFFIKIKKSISKKIKNKI